MRALPRPDRDEIAVELGELFAYPDSVTDETTDADELPRVVDERIDLEQTVRDAMVTELPLAPLCRPDCPGLCVELRGEVGRPGARARA